MPGRGSTICFEPKLPSTHVLREYLIARALGGLKRPGSAAYRLARRRNK